MVMTWTWRKMDDLLVVQFGSISLHIVPATKKSLKPAIENDEQVTRTHFPELEFGYPTAAVAPSDRDGGP